MPPLPSEQRSWGWPDAGLDLEHILSFRYQRVVAMDNTVRLDGRLIQVPPGPKRRSYAGARVWVHEFLDGSLGVWYQDRWLVRTPAGTSAAVVRARKRRPSLPEKPGKLSSPRQPVSNRLAPQAAPHPWRRWNPSYLNPRSLTESLSH